MRNKLRKRDDLESFIKGGGWKGFTLSKPLPSSFITGGIKG